MSVPQTKQFSNADYNECNSPGITMVSELFTSKGYVVEPFTELKGKKDFYVVGPNKKSRFRVEAERRTRFAAKPISTYFYGGILYFKYDTLHVLQRKQVEDQWDFYSQVMDCYNLDTNEQTFAVATVFKAVLKNLKTTPVDCYRKGVQITEGEEMGDVPISKVLWTVLQDAGDWPSVQATNQNYGKAHTQFMIRGLQWEDLLGELNG